MSHFTVLVKVTKDRLDRNQGDISDAIREMLLPYQENNMGDCDKKYMVFYDATNEFEEFKNRVVDSKEYIAKEKPESIGKTYFEFFGDECEEYFDHRKDPETGKYGYWENPNAKWDWYSIGGRWSGLIPVHASYSENCVADYCPVKFLNIEKLNKDTEIAIEKFWLSYEMKGEDINWQLTDILTQMGLMDSNGNVKYFSKQDIYDNHRGHFEFGTFAVLDDSGWKEQGKMGWFGISSDTADDRRNWSKSYMENFILNENPETTLVVVDCHI